LARALRPARRAVALRKEGAEREGEARMNNNSLTTQWLLLNWLLSASKIECSCRSKCATTGAQRRVAHRRGSKIASRRNEEGSIGKRRGSKNASKHGLNNNSLDNSMVIELVIECF